MIPNVTSLTMAELDELSIAVAQEKDRRILLATADDQINDILTRVREATGFESGDAWTQPEGAHDSFPVGVTVSYGGKLWVSLTTANVWTPGTSGWREVVETGGPAEWVQPTGAHDVYDLGDEVAHAGKIWESTVANNSWAPGVYGWVEVGPQQPL